MKDSLHIVCHNPVPSGIDEHDKPQEYGWGSEFDVHVGAACLPTSLSLVLLRNLLDLRSKNNPVEQLPTWLLQYYWSPAHRVPAQHMVPSRICLRGEASDRSSLSAARRIVPISAVRKFISA